MPILSRTWSRFGALVAAFLGLGVPLQRLFSRAEDATTIAAIESPDAPETAHAQVAEAIAARPATTITPEARPIGQQLFDNPPRRWAPPIDDSWFMGTPRVLLEALSRTSPSS
jgi:hypothetical protein